MVDKAIRDLRKIVDKTTEVKVTIIDKPPILASRGVSSFDNNDDTRQDIEGTYTFAQIIDGTDGPRLHDETNTEDPWDHVAKITGMTDPEFTDLSLILKPDGVFD